jgi:hypothetical protein
MAGIRGANPRYAGPVTHEYTILLGGVVIPSGGGDAEPVAHGPSAIAWAADTILAVGSDEEVRAVSRGDSHVHVLGGAVVRPADDGGRLEVGGRADMDLLAPDSATTIAVIRAGTIVEGALPGDRHHVHHEKAADDGAADEVRRSARGLGAPGAPGDQPPDSSAGRHR